MIKIFFSRNKPFCCSKPEEVSNCNLDLEFLSLQGCAISSTSFLFRQFLNHKPLPVDRFMDQ